VADRYPAIEDHAVIGNLHTVALVATDGTIDWCCMPRFDSPALFASLLDADRGGSFAIRSEAVRTRQLYMPDSNVLVTRFLGTDSVGEVVDFMVPRHPESGLQDPGRGHVLVRRLRAVRGSVVFKVSCRPAFDFGRQEHSVVTPDRGGAMFSSPGSQAELFLRSSTRFLADGPTATATVTLGPGEGLDLLLEWGGRPEPPAEGEADRLQEHTMAYWRNWLRRSRYRGRYREMVERSALVLKLLVYEPTGALVAAPTTSLPEAVGGTRNWDYRYTWIRDAALSLDGLMRLGFTDEAAGFMAWLEARCGEAASEQGLQVLTRSTAIPRCQKPCSIISTAIRVPGLCAWAIRPPGSFSWTSTAS
jgi:GH15 family glucan-1,4-alpha-glucosidase